MFCFSDKAENELSWDREGHKIDMETADRWKYFFSKT